MSGNHLELSQYNHVATGDLLRRTADIALGFLSQVEARRVGADVLPPIGDPLPEIGEDSRLIIESMARAAEPGLVASNGPRYFGFVTGGSLPAALAADWLTSAWDQNASLHVMSPAAAAVEAVAAEWLVALFGLPVGTSVGFTTGATMANFTALAAARHAVLARVGWDVRERGLARAPHVAVVVGAHVHASVQVALRMLGFGCADLRRVAVDDQGRMRVDALAATLADVDGPLVVCAQAGHVCTGAFDPLAAIADAVAARGGWLHVDGAFGLWAAAAPGRAHLIDGVARADSWATDAHKWLNVPYDSGVVLVRDRLAHRAASAVGASYLVAAEPGERDGSDWVPELSRRARGFTVYAALRSLGRQGVAALVERCCARARQMSDLLGAADGVTILNDVELNQVLVRFMPARGGDAGAFTRDVIRRVQEDGTCWLGGTTWNDTPAMRVSVSHWATSEDDIARSAAAILRCLCAANEAWTDTVTPERART
jgi:glutamate/tyrosine decarboxylase-like PLP-dependent enzyme